MTDVKHLSVIQRQCGECHACCIAPEVESLKKPDWERCKHLKESGCNIYGNHPQDCRHYYCGWMQGLGDDEHRPDRIGVMFSLLTSEIIGDHVIVHELEEGALKKVWVHEQIKNLGNKLPVFKVLPNGSRRLLVATSDRWSEIEKIAG